MKYKTVKQKVLMNNSDIKLVDVRYNTAETGTDVYLNIQFDKRRKKQANRNNRKLQNNKHNNRKHNNRKHNNKNTTTENTTTKIQQQKTQHQKVKQQKHKKSNKNR